MRRRAQLQQKSPHGANVLDPVFLLALDARARNLLLELPGQMLFNFASVHNNKNRPFNTPYAIVPFPKENGPKGP